MKRSGFADEDEDDEDNDDDEGGGDTVPTHTPKSQPPKLIFYIAPTATGKTLTPIMLCNQYRVIFMCAARHVGLALARAAISMGKKIAFAFGCETASDIRLHYAAAVEFTRDRRSGGIRKVDNERGEKVEIIICDIKSYVVAMIYMLAFNPVENLLTYWDEPTITMDYPDHPLHATLARNWRENLVPNLILSSATLPRMEELQGMMSAHAQKFPTTEFVTIQSFDSKKSIPLVSPLGLVEMPHTVSVDPVQVLAIIRHCEANPTLLRYLDLAECVRFVQWANEETLPPEVQIKRCFQSLDDLTMTNIKTYYLRVLRAVVEGGEPKWPDLFTMLKSQQPNYYQRFGHLATSSTSPLTAKAVGVFVTTKDAYTLTDGPTLYLAENVDTIANFLLAQSNIPSAVTDEIADRISHNNEIRLVMDELQKEIESMEAARAGGSGGDNSTAGNEGKKGGRQKGARKETPSKEYNEDKETRGAMIDTRNKLELLQSRMKPVRLTEHFVPNKPPHLKLWASASHDGCRPFTSDIDETTVVEIMSLGAAVEDKWKILLLMGVGVFGRQGGGSAMDSRYTEIMKRMAQNQRLFLIIATGDYIYGTNYQFCHGYIGKDLMLTQQKLLQAMGRVGRNSIQQQYSIRLRNEMHACLLFAPQEGNMEAEVMNRLFG